MRINFHFLRAVNQFLYIYELLSQEFESIHNLSAESRLNEVKNDEDEQSSAHR